MKSIKQRAFEIQNAIGDQATIEALLEEYEAFARADERVKATAEIYEKMSRTFIPREGGQS